MQSATVENSSQKLFHIVRQMFPNLKSKSQANNAITNSQIFVNNEIQTNPASRPNKGDVITLLSEFNHPIQNSHFSIVFQDDFLAVLWKECGITASDRPENTVEIKMKPLLTRTDSSSIDPVCIVPLVSKAVSGFVLVAKTLELVNILSEMSFNGEINYTFVGVCALDIGEKYNISEDETVSLVQEHELKFIKRYRSRNTSSGYLSLIQLSIKTIDKNINPCNLVKIIMEIENAPFIGISKHTFLIKSASGKGTFIQLNKIEFTHPITKSIIKFEKDIPNKFTSYCEREDQAWVKKRNIDENQDDNVKFYNLDFIVSNDTLVPRVGTESLVDEALKRFDDSSLNILDLGCGSGCILISLLKNRSLFHGVCLDISEPALDIAKQNSIALQVIDRISFCQGTFKTCGSDIKDAKLFDLIVCNPPYLSTKSEITGHLAKDPKLAIISGDTGFECYLEIIEGLSTGSLIFKDECILLLEIRHHAFKLVSKLIPEVVGKVKFDFQELVFDKNGFERCLVYKLSILK